MKGRLASEYHSLEGEYSDLQVCKSAAGYYIGTMFTCRATDECIEFVEPGSRESVEYFDTFDIAEIALATGVWTQRSHP